jgi:predicted PurR-regulated permease PerM
LVILALAAVVVFVIVRLEVLFVALFVALLITALLDPAATLLRRVGLPGALATAAVMLGALAVVGGLLYFVTRAVLDQREEFAEAVSQGVEQVRTWVSATFGTSLEELGAQVGSWFGNLGGGEGGGGITASVFGVASTALEVISGAGIALFATIFFVHDGPRIWSWVTSLFTERSRGYVDTAGRLSWQSLAAYARGTVLIAAIDAIGIGLGVALVGVPLAGPIAVLVFFGSFIPIIGATISGLVAVLIALATVGLTGALLVLAIVIGVQQLEGHVLQPLIQGRMMSLHPLAVVLAVAGGSIVAGLVGAVIAVPIVSVVNVLVRYAAGVSRGEGQGGTEGGAAAGAAQSAPAAGTAVGSRRSDPPSSGPDGSTPG